MFEYKYPKSVSLRSYNPSQKGHSGQIQKALDLLLKAEKPMIYSGGVILGEASDALTALTRELGFPITNTLMGLGGFPGTDHQFLGMLGMHGTYEANNAMHHCDVLLAVGARFDDRITNTPSMFCPNAKIIHIDVDPASISKTIRADIPIVGDVGVILKEMMGLVKNKKSKKPDKILISKWWDQIALWREQDCLKIKRTAENDQIIKPQDGVKAVYEATRGEAFVTSDVGQHQMFAALYYPFDEPRKWINSGGLGTMGFGLPSAMGAQIAFPESTVVCITVRVVFK